MSWPIFFSSLCFWIATLCAQTRMFWAVTHEEKGLRGRTSGCHGWAGALSGALASSNFFFFFCFRTTPYSIGIAEDGFQRFWKSCHFGYWFDPFTFKFDSGCFEGFRVWGKDPRLDPVRCQYYFLLGTALKGRRVRASAADALWLLLHLDEELSCPPQLGHTCAPLRHCAFRWPSLLHSVHRLTSGT